jgi:hypothetical protein
MPDVQHQPLRFVPSRVDGLPAVTEVAVWPDRIELLSSGRWVTYRFEDIAEWPRPRWLRRLLARAGLRPKWLPVGLRDWFKEPPDRHFKFFCDPPVKVRMPVDEPEEHQASHFWRIQEVLGSGGYDTYDMG